LVVVFFILARVSDIVRDSGPDPVPVNGDPPPAPSNFGNKGRRPFSLARCQMAWWFFIVVGTYLYIWMVTGDRDSLTAGVLTLIGISAATGFGSLLVDSSKQDARRAALEKERDSLDARINQIGNPVDAAQRDEKVQKEARLKDVQALLNGESQGFFKDILQDDDGVSFHRFQMAVWTVVLGVVFLRLVFKELSMPDFSATLLGLMGISSGTYVGFKIPDPPKQQ
jgi:hypothetical protein